MSYGFSSLKGKRQRMEDYIQAEFSQHPVTGEPVGLFGVFDGHGGAGAAAFVSENLLNELLSHEKFHSDLKTAMTESFISTDQQYLADGGPAKDDGCTAVAAVLVGNKLAVANVGDSRAVLSRNSKAIAMSEDHKPNRADERKRIEAAGGVVVWAGTWRVGGVLAVSRAFGDRLLKRFVVADPDILEAELGAEDRVLILATDGLWDVISNEEAIRLIRHIGEAEAAAKKLTDEAFARGSSDNISCVVVQFKYDEVIPPVECAVPIAIASTTITAAVVEAA